MILSAIGIPSRSVDQRDLYFSKVGTVNNGFSPNVMVSSKLYLRSFPKSRPLGHGSMALGGGKTVWLPAVDSSSIQMSTVLFQHLPE